MWNVALVGHSQIPTHLKLEETNLTVFRTQAGKHLIQDRIEKAVRSITDVSDVE